MKNRAFSLMWVLCACSLLLLSCSSGSDSSTGNTSGGNSTGNYSGPHWTVPLSGPLFTASTSMIEVEHGYFTMVSMDNPIRSIILSVNKETGAIGTREIPNYKVSNFVPDPDGNLLTLNETGEDPDYTVRLTTFSREGEKLREELFQNASLQYAMALAKCDDGVVFGIYKTNDGPELVKTDFDGNMLWEKRYTNKLDPGLVGAEYIEPGVIQCVKKDTDGNFIVAQHLIKKNTEDLEDSGYAIYQVTPDGELIWSKPYYLGVTAWQQDTFAKVMLLLQDGTIVIEDASSGGSPGQDIAIKYLDNEGDFIRKIHIAHAGIGPLALSTDQNIIYSNREYNPQAGGEETVCYKFGLDGTTIWKKTYSLETSEGEQLWIIPDAVHLCSDNGFLIVTSYCGIDPTPSGVALLKIDENGKLTGQLSL